ncbi:MAG: hypothetical protein KVP17_001663 [Porospora cf. gigantea B]|uniref:uncharacterized protein n=1 Tax=Porospora cf. gigantea B TaxID=2853592 RepID=UPI003571DC91|nr:MAG: hypothetical protein KVP17_001663 [Porospora cf. gigantea B]
MLSLHTLSPTNSRSLAHSLIATQAPHLQPAPGDIERFQLYPNQNQVVGQQVPIVYAPPVYAPPQVVYVPIAQPTNAQPTDAQPTDAQPSKFRNRRKPSTGRKGRKGRKSRKDPLEIDFSDKPAPMPGRNARIPKEDVAGVLKGLRPSPFGSSALAPNPGVKPRPDWVHKVNAEHSSLARAMVELDTAIQECRSHMTSANEYWCSLRVYMAVFNQTRRIQKQLRLVEDGDSKNLLTTKFSTLFAAAMDVLTFVIRLDGNLPDRDSLEWAQWMRRTAQQALQETSRGTVEAVPLGLLVRKLREDPSSATQIGSAVVSILKVCLQTLEEERSSLQPSDVDQFSGLHHQASALKRVLDGLTSGLTWSGFMQGVEDFADLHARCELLECQLMVDCFVRDAEDPNLLEELGRHRRTPAVIDALSKFQAHAMSSAQSPVALKKAMHNVLRAIKIIRRHLSDIATKANASPATRKIFTEAASNLQTLTAANVGWWAKEAGHAMLSEASWVSAAFAEEQKLLIRTGDLLQEICHGHTVAVDLVLGYLAFKELSVKFSYSLSPLTVGTVLAEGNDLLLVALPKTGLIQQTVPLSSEAQRSFQSGSMRMLQFLKEMSGSDVAMKIIAAKGANFPVFSGGSVTWVSGAIHEGRHTAVLGLTSSEIRILKQAAEYLPRNRRAEVNMFQSTIERLAGRLLKAQGSDRLAGLWLDSIRNVTRGHAVQLLPQEEALNELLRLGNQIVRSNCTSPEMVGLLKGIGEVLRSRLEMQFAKLWATERLDSGLTFETLIAVNSAVTRFIEENPDLLRSGAGRGARLSLLAAAARSQKYFSGDHQMDHDIVDAFHAQDLLLQRDVEKYPCLLPLASGRFAADPRRKTLYMEPAHFKGRKYAVALWRSSFFNRYKLGALQKSLEQSPLHQFAVQEPINIFRFVHNLHKPKQAEELAAELGKHWTTSVELLSKTRTKAKANTASLDQKTHAVARYFSVLIGACQLHSIITVAVKFLNSCRPLKVRPALTQPLNRLASQIAEALREDLDPRAQHTPVVFHAVLPGNADREALRGAEGAAEAAQFDQLDEGKGLLKAALVEFFSYCSPMNLEALDACAAVGHLVRLSALQQSLDHLLGVENSHLLLDASFQGKHGHVHVIDYAELSQKIGDVSTKLVDHLVKLLEKQSPPEAVRKFAQNSMTALDADTRRRLREALLK